jgi:hypothetical protein
MWSWMWSLLTKLTKKKLDNINEKKTPCEGLPSSMAIVTVLVLAVAVVDVAAAMLLPLLLSWRLNLKVDVGHVMCDV